MKTDYNIDKQLVEAYKNGDGKALAALVKRWHKLFCDKAYWMIKDKDAAKDIAQDSWTTIIDKINTLKEPKQFKYWAYRIVCNKSTDWLRLQSKEINRSVDYNSEIKSEATVFSEDQQLKRLLLRAVNELPVNQKEVVKLFYIQDYSLKQIGDLLKISVGTAKSRLFHARETLKKTLKHKNYEN